LKKVLTFVFISLLLPYYAKGQVLMDENFNYTAGDSLGAHGWVTFSGITNTLIVVTPGLIYSGYINSNIGNSVRVRNNGYDAYKSFNPDTAGSIYLSFMVRIDSARTGDYFIAFLPNTSTTSYFGRVFIRDSSGFVAFGVSKSTNPIVYSPAIYNYNATYLIVVKYSFLPGTQDDEVSLFIIAGAVPAAEPTPTVGPVTQAINDAAALGRIALRQGTASSSPTSNVDGIRVCKSWANLLLRIVPISKLAENFSLKQNYPNPFNPTTTIEFSIPRKTNVRLKIYDCVGKEVSSLVNGQLNHGTYKVDFDARAYPSGIYFYGIETDAFTDTRKMILVK
jgi:type IX secretion system substrate protein